MMNTLVMESEKVAKPESHTASIVGVWAVLVVLTLISYWFKDHGLSEVVAASVILGISFIKVFLVGNTFMELSIAPKFLRTTFASWCIASFVLLVGMVLIF